MNDNCVICLENFTRISKTTTLECNHKYHSSCILKWKKKNNICPICRETIPIQIKPNILNNICLGIDWRSFAVCCTILVLFFGILFIFTSTIVYNIYSFQLGNKCFNLNYDNCISSKNCKWVNMTSSNYCSNH